MGRERQEKMVDLEKTKKKRFGDKEVGEPAGKE